MLINIHIFNIELIWTQQIFKTCPGKNSLKISLKNKGNLSGNLELINIETKQDEVFIGSDCIDSYLDALIAL